MTFLITLLYFSFLTFKFFFYLCFTKKIKSLIIRGILKTGAWLFSDFSGGVFAFAVSIFPPFQKFNSAVPHSFSLSV